MGRALARQRGLRTSHGIAEWYSRLYRSLTAAERLEFVNLPAGERVECRFLADMPGLAPGGRTFCNKKGGVCSLRPFFQDEEHNVTFGSITATCPNRFLEGGTVFNEIAKTLLGTEHALIAKEIPFLIRPQINGDDDPAQNDADLFNQDLAADNEDVGRIDMVMVHPHLERLSWCAVELQAVYFSGGAISKDYSAIRADQGNGFPMPGANRRADYRSSGPKRLMPQLQIKVPALRRWGKKMAVVVDRPFFDSLGPMDDVSDISNSDIIWFIVRFDDDPIAGQATMAVDEIRRTTLERAVEGLTAGTPTSLDEFERKLRGKLG